MAITRVGENGGFAPTTNWADTGARTTNPLGGAYDTSSNANAPIVTQQSITPTATTLTPPASDPLKDPNKQPPAPKGSSYKWIVLAGGGGEWRLYNDAVVGGSGTDTGTGTGTGVVIPPVTPGGSANANPGALQIITDALTAAGLGSLASQAWTMWNKGFDMNAIMDDPANGIRASVVYKQNFPAMAALNAAGRGINEATYLAKENADLEIMKQYTLPPGVFDSKDYLGKLMINNVNTVDLTNRLNAAQNTVLSYDPAIKKYAQDTFGIGAGDLMAWALDPTKALPVIQQQAQAMQIGGAAIQAGFGGAGANGELTQEQSGALAAQGVTQAQAQQGFTNLGQMGQYAQALPGTDVSGSLTNQQMIDAQFQSNAAAVQSLQKVKGTRTAEFQAGGGAAATAAGVVGAGANLAT